MTDISPAYADAIAAVRPDLASAGMILHVRGWDSDAVEAGGTIFKFPKRPEAVARLRMESRLLGLVRPRVPIAVPDMRLHESPRVFSEHAMIPGDVLETRGYDALEPAQQEALADALAAFYAALHAIPVELAVAVGVEAKPEWPTAAVALHVLVRRLPASMHGFAARAFVAYQDLPAEPTVLGYFDGHGWNMAFDHQRGVLNGLYDFADAGLGPKSRDFTYSSLTSAGLTERLMAAYEHRTGGVVDRRTVSIRTSVHLLSELAEADEDIGPFLARLSGWHDYMQARPEMRI